MAFGKTNFSQPIKMFAFPSKVKERLLIDQEYLSKREDTKTIARLISGGGFLGSPKNPLNLRHFAMKIASAVFFSKSSKFLLSVLAARLCTDLEMTSKVFTGGEPQNKEMSEDVSILRHMIIVTVVCFAC